MQEQERPHLSTLTDTYGTVFGVSFLYPRKLKPSFLKELVEHYVTSVIGGAERTLTLRTQTTSVCITPDMIRARSPHDREILVGEVAKSASTYSELIIRDNKADPLY